MALVLVDGMVSFVGLFVLEEFEEVEMPLPELLRVFFEKSRCKYLQWVSFRSIGFLPYSILTSECGDSTGG
jgi:hypothetical protein